jgi:hypothetical protein
MFNSEMETALRLLGVRFTFLPASSRPTLGEFAGGCDAGKRYIVNVTGHYVALQDGLCVDNRIRFGCPVEEHPSRRKRVKAYFVIHDDSQAVAA